MQNQRRKLAMSDPMIPRWEQTRHPRTHAPTQGFFEPCSDRKGAQRTALRVDSKVKSGGPKRLSFDHPPTHPNKHERKKTTRSTRCVKKGGLPRNWRCPFCPLSKPPISKQQQKHTRSSAYAPNGCFLLVSPPKNKPPPPKKSPKKPPPSKRPKKNTSLKKKGGKKPLLLVSASLSTPAQ